jgi:CRISPR/Cas system CSM-associated protein Csm3 (group 7 of RAMP superfamily)
MTITTSQPPAGETDQPSRIRSVTLIRFVLVFHEPGGVTVPGFPDRDDDAPWGRERAHLLVDTDPWGRPQLPGTSLAGALREMIRGTDDQAAADALFGQLLPARSGGADVDARASLIWVLGSRPVSPDGTELTAMPSQLRASTAICRSRAAAEANTLRVEEMLPAGSRFEVFLRWDDAPAAGLDRLLAQLAAWRPLIGRGTSRGRGSCAIETIRHGTLRLDDPAGLHRWLTTSGPDLARAVATTEARGGDTASGPDALARIEMRITGPLRVGSGKPPEATGSQGQQVTPMFRDGDRYVLPGTGLKGLLRSRAEYILRSTGVTPWPCLDQRCGQCWTCEVFGHAGGQDMAARAVGARAMIRITDAAVDDPVPVQRQHVAIDRFTGGAHEGLLYTVDALEAGSFTITVEALAGDLAAGKITEIRAVLRLVLEDLNDGIAGIGAGVARGYGSVTVGLAEAEERGDLPSRGTARDALARMVAASASAEEQ